MLVLKRTHWWVRWAGMFSYEAKTSPTVSLCHLFWAGVLPPFLIVTVPFLFVWGAIASAMVKEIVGIVGVFALGILTIRWRAKRGPDNPVIPTVVTEALWGIKNRVCPLVKLED